MSVRYRRQKVVLRYKIRKERWKWLTGSFFKWAWRASLVSVLLFGGARLSQFLFQADVFMIKSAAVVSDENPRISSRIRKQLSSLVGKPIFSVSLGAMESHLKEQISSLDSLNIKRHYPDRIEVRYQLHEPIAFVKVESENSPPSSNQIKFLSATGRIFWQETPQELLQHLPEVVVASSESISVAYRFLQSWDKIVSERSIGIAYENLRRVEIDLWGEVSIHLKGAEALAETAEMLWGAYDPEVFQEKWSRLEQVCADLKQKSMVAEYINLRQVPEEVPLTLGDKKIVARVIVRPKGLAVKEAGS